MTSFDFNAISSALCDPSRVSSGVDFSGKSLKLDSEKDAKPIIDAINSCLDLQYLTLTGNTLGVAAAQAIAKALESHPELKVARFSDMFTGRMKTEIPPALSALGDGMIKAGARLTVLDLSDNAFGPIGVEGLAKLLESDVCSQLQELRLNNNGLGITGGRLLAKALSTNPRKLRVFVAGRNRLENDGATALANVFRSMGTLEEVAMPQNGIYHPGVTALCSAFRQNPALSCINLNDNTVGPKGVVAFVDALPRLKNLKSINFGDCLIKSKGGNALAQGLKDNSVLLESLDLSHNEMGREACMAIVDAVTASPQAVDTLTRVVLSGNSLGGEANKQIMMGKLGTSAELSDGEGSDEEYVSGSEEGSDDSDGESENSATEDAQHLDTVLDMGKEISLDSSGIEEIETDAGKFLKEPTIDNFNKLGSSAADMIDAHLQAISDPADMIQAYVEATLCISGLSPSSTVADAEARRMYKVLVTRAGQKHAAAWLLANTLLRGLALIKSENKDYKLRWLLPPCYSVLSSELDAPYFPPALKDTLKFFITSKLQSMPIEVKNVVTKHPNLYT